MNFDRKISLGLLVAVCAMIPLIGVSVFTIQKLISDQNAIIEENSHVSVLAERLRFFNVSKTLHVPIYLLTGAPDQIEKFHRYQNEFENAIEELLKVDKDASERDLLISLHEKAQKTYPTIEAGFKLRASGMSGADIDALFRKTVVPINLDVSEACSRLAASAAKREAQARIGLRVSIKRLEEVIAVLTLLATALTGGITWLVIKIDQQKKLAEQQAARISQARKEVIEVVAHDLKNPLTSIFISTEMTLLGVQQSHSEAQIRSYLEMTNRSAKSMQRLIENLLDHAKVEAGCLVLDQQHCDVALFVEDISERFSILAQAKKIQFSADIQQGLPEAAFDQLRVEQVISNLLGNALKFTPESGLIALEASFDGLYLKFSVTDSGPGISPEQVPHVFDRYWQVQETSQQGTGLGLSIAHEIIEAHLGKIWVTSEQGAGSTFAFTLPVPDASPASRSSVGRTASSAVS